MKLNDVGIFFDRDGTINVDADYLSDPDDLELIPGAAEAIRDANRLGVRAFVITNQSGVARGLYSEEDVRAVHQRLTRLLARDGAHIDAFYYCPHHPEYGEAPYRRVCSCRKPKTGMLLQAQMEFGINLASSFVVGDKCTDLQAGRAAACGTVLVLTGYGAIEVEECRKAGTVDLVARDILEAWGAIRGRIEKRHIKA